MKKNDNEKTFFSMMANLSTSVISMIVSLISTVIITRLLTTSEVGIVTYFSSLKNIVTIFCLLSINVSINRMLIDVDDKEKYLSSIYMFSMIFTLLILIIYILFRNFFDIFLGIDYKLLLLMFSFIFFSNGYTIITYYWNYVGDYKKIFATNILASSGAQIFSIVLICLLNNNKYFGRIIGLDTFNIIFGIIFGIVILIKGRFCIKLNYIKKSLKISIPMMPHLLSQILLTSCDLMMINTLVSSSKGGIYGMAYAIAYILYSVLIQMFLPWSPWVYRRLKEGKIEPIYDNSKILIILSAYLCLGLFSVAPEMIKIFLPSTYMEAINLIAPICIGIFFEIMYIFFYDIEYFYKKNLRIALFSIITSIINIILNYFSIKYIGYYMAAYTTLISYLILLILHYIGAKGLDNRKIYNIKYLIILSLLLVLFGGMYIITNNNIIVRYLSLISISILVFIKYHKLAFKLLLSLKERS